MCVRDFVLGSMVAIGVGLAAAPLIAEAQTTGIREVSASERSLIPLQTRLRYTTMVVLAGGRGDPRRHLWRQGLLGHHRDAEHRAREAGEGRRDDQSESRDDQRRGVFVPAHREERWRHAGPQGLRHRRPECTARASRSTTPRPRSRALQAELTEARAAIEAADAARERRDRGVQAAIPDTAAVRVRDAEVREAVPRALDLARRPVHVHQVGRHGAAGALRDEGRQAASSTSRSSTAPTSCRKCSSAGIWRSARNV